jgi:hypothetical protein
MTLQLSGAVAPQALHPAPNDTVEGRTQVEKVRERIAHLDARNVWARGCGPYVLLGLGEEEAVARLSPVGRGLYSLAFRSSSPLLVTGAEHGQAEAGWDAPLFVDVLDDIVDHALVAMLPEHVVASFECVPLYSESPSAAQPG